MAQSIHDIDVILLDCYSLFFRAFHAFPLTLMSPQGQLTNAAYGFTKLLLEVVEEIRPEYLVAAVDMGKPTFRHEEFVEYKANREEAPSELKAQIPLMYDVLRVLNIPTIGVEGFEADDVIGTLSKQFQRDNAELEVGIFTGDRDAYQLVGESIFVLAPGRKPKEGLRLIDSERIIDALGVGPQQVIDYKALCGDASDNIPGVKGVGPKTAQSLLAQFGSLLGIYVGRAVADQDNAWLQQFAGDISLEQQAAWGTLFTALPAKLQQKLRDSQDSAWISQKLATIQTQVPLAFTLSDAKMSVYDKAAAVELFTQLGFTSLLRRLPKDEYEAAVQASLF